MTRPIEFETKRLRLRQWLPIDREPFAALNADTKVMESFPAPLDRTASDAMADRCQSLIIERGWGFWVAEIKETGQFIGFVGLHVPIAELPFSPCVEIGCGSPSNTGARGSLRKHQELLLALASSRLVCQRSCPLPQFGISGRVQLCKGLACTRLPKHLSILMCQ